MGSRRCQIMGSGKDQRRVPPPVGLALKRYEKRTKMAAESGRSKGLIPTPRERMIARRSRSYKWKDYPTWAKKYDGRTQARGGKE